MRLIDCASHDVSNHVRHSIHFKKGNYDPTTLGRVTLLAHEIAHSHQYRAAGFNSHNVCMRPSFSNSTSHKTSIRKLFAPRPFWVFVIGCVCVVVFGLRFWMNSKHAVFLRTTSPNNTYSVVLKGDKGRPWIIPRTVSADVFKHGQPSISDIWLHTTYDALDLSFEAGFPNVIWLDDSTVEFYRPQYYADGADSLIVSNRAAKSIAYLRIQSVNKFLLFDIQPGATILLEVPAPRSDSQYIGLQGTFTGDEQISFNSKDFDRRSTHRKRFVYQISIDESGSSIATKGLSSP